MKKTIKIIIALFVLICCLVLFAGCEAKMGNRIVNGRDVQTMTYGYIQLGGNKIAEGHITQWRDYDNSDVVQVLIGGKYYLTSYTNAVLIADPEQGALSYGDSSWAGVEE